MRSAVAAAARPQATSHIAALVTEMATDARAPR
jgi:hypothetical protein